MRFGPLSPWYPLNRRLFADHTCSQYCIADERIAFPVAPSLDLDEVVTIPLATATAWLALLSKSCLDMSQEKGKKTPVLIWGGGCKSSSLFAPGSPLSSPHSDHLTPVCPFSHRWLFRNPAGPDPRTRSHYDVLPEELRSRQKARRDTCV